MKSKRPTSSKSLIKLLDLKLNIFGSKLVIQLEPTRMDKYKSYDPMKKRLFELANKEW